MGLAAVAVALTACGGSEARSHAVVAPATPNPLVVPGLAPAGLVVDRAEILSGARYASGDQFVLYGESARDDPLEGKVFVAGMYASSALGTLARDGCTPAGEVSRCGAWVLSQPSNPNCIEDCFAFVAGRNVSADEVAAAAASASFVGHTPVIPKGALPDGVTALVAAPVELSQLVTPNAELIQYRPTGGRRLSVVGVDGGQPLADLFRFFVAPDGTMAPFDVWRGSPARADIRADGDTVIVVLAAGLSSREVSQFAASIRRGDRDAWEALRAEATNVPANQLVSGGMPPGGYDDVLAGRFSTGQWAVGFRRDPGGRYVVSIASNGPDLADQSGSTSGPLDAGPGDKLTVMSVETSAGGTNFAGTMVTGVASAETSEVVVEYAGRTAVATLGATGILPRGARFWAVFVEHRTALSEAGPAQPLTVVARDPTGHELERTSR